MSEATQSSPLRRMIAHGGIYTLSRIAGQLAAFVLVPLYAHTLGSSGLGIVEITNAVRDVLVIVMLQGAANAMMRMRYELKDQREQLQLESTLTWYVAGTSLALCGAMWLVGEPLWRWVGESVPFAPFGLLTFAIAMASAICQLLDRKLQTDQEATKLAIITLVRTLITLGAIVVFVVPLGRGAAGKLEGEALATVAAAISAWVMLAPGSPRNFSVEHMKRGLAWGLPFVPHGIAAVINGAIDRVMLNAMLGLSAAGIYSLGYRVASVTLIVMMNVNQAFTPLFIESMRKLELETADDVRARLKHQLSKLGTVFMTIGALAVQGVTAIGPTIIALLGTDEFYASWRVLAPVGGSALAWTCYAVWSQSVTYTRKGVRLMPWITAAATAFHVALGYALIPWLGIEGAAWATCLSNMLQALLCLVVGRQHAPVPYAWNRWIGLLALSALGLGLQTWIEMDIASQVTRLALKAGWLAAFTYAAIGVVGVKLRDLRPRRAAL